MDAGAAGRAARARHPHGSISPRCAARCEGKWRIYARSASDDKAPILAIVAALDALRATGTRPSVNLKLFFEGEEEAGSSHLAAVLEKNRELLRADAWLLCDGPVHQSRRMQVVFGVRGVTDVEITVSAPRAPSTAATTATGCPTRPWRSRTSSRASATPTAGSRCPGSTTTFVRSPRRSARRSPPCPTSTRRFARTWPSRRRKPAARASSSGSCCRRSTSAACSRERSVRQASNAIPTEARASIDFRLVPDQTPQKVRERVEAHLRAQGWSVVHAEPTLDERRTTPNLVRLDWAGGYPAARTALELPFSRRLLAVVGEDTEEPVIALPTLGGSVPMLLFIERSGCPS